MALESRKAVICWLYTCCVLIALMVFVGGVTRLTESGLSIVEWKPMTGVLPPLSHHAWEKEFIKYQQTPEYLHKNQGMELSDFKKIYFWEFTHRLLGRLVGVVFFAPFLYFSLKGKLDKSLVIRCLFIFVLGSVQGFLGWFMVKSGLVERPDVSQYRLAIHLLAAVVLYAFILWTAWTIRHQEKAVLPSPYMPYPPVWMRYYAYAITLAVLVQMVSGAFVAGLNAGLIYNTFPTMNGQWVPDEIGFLSPWYSNLFENITTVQFAHRMWAIFTSLLIFGLWHISRAKNVRGTLCHTEKNKIHCLAAMLVLQFTLGVSTLLHGVPLVLASMHQLGALALLTFALSVSHALTARKEGKKTILEGISSKVPNAV